MGGSAYTTALGGDRDVLVSLRPGMHGRVHSAFRSVINVTTGHPDLMSLTAASVARAPRSIQLGIDRMDRLGIAVGDRVSSDGHTLRVGEHFVVVVSATPVWEERPPNGSPLASRIGLLEDLLSARHVPGKSAFERAVAESLQNGLAELRRAVRAGDGDAAYHAAASLVGLGPGLTPTGDDVLTGAAFAASRLNGSLDVVRDAVALVADTGTTNDISLTAMRCALRGRAVQPIEDLYSWLCGADTHNPHRLVTDVYAIGHTSGADLALGLLTAVRLHQESQER